MIGLGRGVWWGMLWWRGGYRLWEKGGRVEMNVGGMWIGLGC